MFNGSISRLNQILKPACYLQVKQVLAQLWLGKSRNPDWSALQVIQVSLPKFTFRQALFVSVQAQVRGDQPHHDKSLWRCPDRFGDFAHTSIAKIFYRKLDRSCVTGFSYIGRPG